MSQEGTTIPVEEFLAQDIPLLDVRSPGEYSAGHIPGAVSFPLFNDLERAEIGTLYKQVSADAAFSRGLRIAEPKIPDYLEHAQKLGTSFRIHCWRGGMRSRAMADLLREHGYDCEVLKGGYKAYRQSMMSFLERPMRLRVLTGHTGSMKTEVLHAIRSMGEQFIDLEGLANHQGSSFGNVHTTGQPTTEQFQNDLYEAVRGLDLERVIWIEDESMMIGKCAVPNPLFLQKESAPHFLIEIADSKRLSHLVNNYGGLEPLHLTKAMEGIRKKLGHERCDLASDHISKGNLREAARIALVYYDKQYSKAVEKKKHLVKQQFSFQTESPEEIARHLLDGIN